MNKWQYANRVHCVRCGRFLSTERRLLLLPVADKENGPSPHDCDVPDMICERCDAIQAEQCSIGPPEVD